MPRDLSVVGFDNITMTNYTDPPLTTIGVIKEQMGRRATTRLLELVDGLNREVKEERVPVDSWCASPPPLPERNRTSTPDEGIDRCRIRQYQLNRLSFAVNRRLRAPGVDRDRRSG